MIDIFERQYAPGSKLGVHAHLLPSMSLVVSGTIRERFGRTEQIARPLSISLMAAGASHDDEFGADGARLLQVHFDGQAAREYAAELGAPEEWRWISGGPAVRPFIRLLSAVRAQLPARVLEQMVVDTIAAATSGPRAARGSPPAWLTRVKHAIDDSAEWPRVRELASVGGVHRVHLAREFRRYFGMTVSGYRRQRNLLHAAERVSRTSRTLSQIAHEAGFSDHPHMARAFRTTVGVAPGVFRALSATPSQRFVADKARIAHRTTAART